MNELYIVYLTLIINTLSMIAACVMLYLVYKQTKTNQEWNRRKTSEETLTKLVMDEFYNLLNQLTLQYDWDPINQNKNYDHVLSEISENQQKVKELQVTTRSLLRITETICISMKHNMIDETICYDYLFSILVNLYKKNLAFISSERTMRNNSHVFEYVEYYAKKWEAQYMSTDSVDNEQHKKRLFSNRKKKL